MTLPNLPLINDCLDQLKADLTKALVEAHANTVYGYRTMPDKLEKTVSLTYLGGGQESGTTGGKSWHYDFAAVIAAQHDGTESQLEAAERALNDMENVILDALGGSRNNLWMKVVIYQPSRRPPSRIDMASSRFGEIYFRLLLKG